MADIEAVGVGEIEQVNSDERRNLLAEQLEAAEPVQIETPAEPTEKPAADRARAPDGKFAPKVEAAPAGEAPAAPEEPKWKKPPQSWKKELADHWGKMEPASVEKILQTVHEREEQMRAGIEPARQKAVQYDKIAQVVQPYEQTIRGLGIDVPTAIKGLMQADHILRSSPPDQKRAYLLQLAQSYGVQLGDVSNQPPVNQDVFTLKNEIMQIRGAIDADKRAKEEAEQANLLSEIQKFATKAEHFEDAKPTMIQLLQSGVATDLQDAYDKAIRLNDDLFQSHQAALQAKAEQEKKASKDQAAKVARSAAVSVRSSAPGTHTASKAQDRRSKLAEQFGELDERL